MKIRLPEEPKEKQFEDLVAALCQAQGYFTETRLTFKESTGAIEILEIDSVVTPTGTAFRDRILVEAKSGGWGFPDVFKLAGWIQFLGMKRAILLHKKPSDERRVHVEQMIEAKLNVACGSLAQADNIIKILPWCFEVDKKLRNITASTAWYSQIAQRLLQSSFASRCKSDQESAQIKLVDKYKKAFEKVFIEEKPIGRIHALYDAYKQCAHPTGMFVKLHSKDVDDEKRLWGEVNNKSDKPWLQHIMLLEHKARIGIIKGALDHLESGRADSESELVHGSKITWTELQEALAPTNFKRGLELLKEFKNRNRIPYFFQIFTEVLGGFYIKGNEEDESIACKLTGVQPDEIETILHLYDVFFPFENGKSWFYSYKNLVRIKVFPGAIRGMGCFFRQSLHGFKSYPEKYGSDYQFLADWHNASIHILGSEIAVKGTEPALSV